MGKELLTAHEALKLAREHLGAHVQDVMVEPYTDSTGDPAYGVTVVLDELDLSAEASGKRYDLARAFLDDVHDRGDERFPYISYVTKADMDALAVDD
jgi:hypothetical protein